MVLGIGPGPLVSKAEAHLPFAPSPWPESLFFLLSISFLFYCMAAGEACTSVLKVGLRELCGVPGLAASKACPTLCIISPTSFLIFFIVLFLKDYRLGTTL